MSDNEPTRPIRSWDNQQLPQESGPPPAQHEPGWMPDPWSAGQQRYWDGRAWTGHMAAAQSPGIVAAYQQPQPPPAHPQHVYPATYGYPHHATVVMTDANPNGVHIAFAWIFAILTLGYFFPWAVAATRGKSNALPIALLNFFLGWTFLGWVVALVMACGSHQSYAVAR